MGTWGTGISSNDTFADIYDEFFELYNEGIPVKEISERLLKSNKEIINIPEDVNNFWFALALCQWECKELEKDLFEKVEKIINSKNDLSIWRETGASEPDIKKREKVLEKFLEKLKTERKTARKIKPKVLIDSIFQKGDCLAYIMENGNYGGAFVLTDEKQTEVGGNFIAVTNIDKIEKPVLEDFKKSGVIIWRRKNIYFENQKPIEKWEEKPVIGIFMAKIFKNENLNIEVIGNLKIYKKYKPENNFMAFGWKRLLEILPEKEQYERINGIPKSKLKLSEWIEKRWYNIF